MKSKLLPVFLLLASINIFPQWNQIWSSSQLDYNTSSGFFSFKKTGDNWENRFYTVDSLTFKIMQEGYSNTPQYSYTFTSAEKTAGAQVYSLGYDLTGDNIVEFYILGYYGPSTNYRQTFKIVDIANNNIVFQKDESDFSFSYPVITDLNNDNTLECTFSKSNYPSYNTYSYEVYNTGITSGNKENFLKLNFQIKQNYPNPFNPSTIIEYSLASPSIVKIEIYDITGEVIKTLENSYQESGSHTTEWNGTDNNSNRVATGIYFYKITSGTNSQTKKMIFLK